VAIAIMTAVGVAIGALVRTSIRRDVS